MSINKNKLLIRRFIDEIINTGDIDEIEKFISPDYTEVYEGKKYKIGIKGAKEHILGVRQTYPDLHRGVRRGYECIGTNIKAKYRNKMS